MIDDLLPYYGYCANCGTVIGRDEGPKDGWQLEDGRTVCNKCCVIDTILISKRISEPIEKRIH